MYLIIIKGTIVRPAVVYGPYSYTWGLQEAILINQGKGVLIDGANNIVSYMYRKWIRFHY